MKQRGKNNWSPIPLDLIRPEYKRPSGFFGVRAGACIRQNTVHIILFIHLLLRVFVLYLQVHRYVVTRHPPPPISSVVDS